MELNIIWFVLLVVLFSGYVVLDGFDLGVGMIHFKSRSDHDRRIMLNSIGPVWDGNEVWLITAGGALFAAFPNVYATVFSGFYTAFMLFLMVLIGRAVSIEFRSKVESATWRRTWDQVFHISSYLIALLLGVSLGNILTGVPINVIGGVKEFGGNFFSLLSPFSVAIGIVAVFALRFHGSLFMLIKSDGALHSTIESGLRRSFYYYLITYALVGIWIWTDMPHLTANFREYPVWLVLQLGAILSFVALWFGIGRGQYMKSFIYSSLILVLSIAMCGVGIYPNLLISSGNPADSLTIFADSSSQRTLQTMLIIALIFVPIILVYKFIVYRIFRGKTQIDHNSY